MNQTKPTPKPTPAKSMTPTPKPITKSTGPAPKQSYIGPSTETAQSVLLAGFPGAGKSTTALTLSAHWPGYEHLIARTSGSKPLVFDDVLVLAWEPGGFDCLRPFHASIPNIVDVSRYISADGFERGFLRAVSDAAAVVKEGNIRVVIHDTISTADDYALATYRPGFGETDARKAFGMVLNFHRIYITQCQSAFAACETVYLAHVKPLDETQQVGKGQQVANAGKHLGAAVVDKQLAVTGQAGMIYQKVVSFFLPIVQRPAFGDKPSRRVLLASPAEGYPAKNRYESIIKGEQPPDLRALFNAVK